MYDGVYTVGDLKYALEVISDDTPVVFEHLTDEQYADESGPDYEYSIDELFMDSNTDTLRLLSVGLTDELANEGQEAEINATNQFLFQEATRND